MPRVDVLGGKVGFPVMVVPVHLDISVSKIAGRFQLCSWTGLSCIMFNVHVHVQPCGYEYLKIMIVAARNMSDLIMTPPRSI